MAKLTFVGAAKCVTGSKYLLESGKYRLLIDCGLFQGSKNLRLKNWQSLPFDSQSIDSVILTHAHIDHSGMIPNLVKEGFRGKIYCTGATKDLCKILLPDSARLQEEDATYANRKGFSKHVPALPLYTEDMAYKSLQYFKKKKFHEDFQLGPFSCRLLPAGHILGAASVLIQFENKSIIFSGDLGRENDLMMAPPFPLPQEVNYVVMESTYGERVHSQENPLEKLHQIIEKTVSRGGKILIPAFALGRAQILLFCLYQLKQQGKFKNLPVFLNSPMAVDITELLTKYLGDHRFSEKQCQGISQMVRMVHSIEESKSLNGQKGPMVVISASGMLTGGRALHHLEAWGPDPRNTVLLVGHQVPGTRGHRLLSGEKEIKIHGQYININAEIAHFDSFSAHADQNELINWLENPGTLPQKVFLVHGDLEATEVLQRKIKERLGILAKIPDLNEEFDL